MPTPIPARATNQPTCPQNIPPCVISISLSERRAEVAYCRKDFSEVKRQCQSAIACLLYPRKRTHALHHAMSALGQKQTSANKLRNLFFMGRAANPSTLRQW